MEKTSSRQTRGLPFLSRNQHKYWHQIKKGFNSTNISKHLVFYLTPLTNNAKILQSYIID